MPKTVDCQRHGFSESLRMANYAPMLASPDEPVEVLRQRIFDFTVKCPFAMNHWGCPFRLLSGLGHESRRNLIHSFTKQQCLDLFEMERICREEYKVKS
jgi:hypothetical protein